MEDHFKSSCLYHPSETITNFCKEKSCLMPLCPTCICSHMEEHIKQGKTAPKFDNIHESFANVTTEIKKFNQKFDQAKDRLTVVQRNIIEQKKTLTDLVYTVKNQVRQMVETSFDELEKDLIRTIEKQNETIGVHVPQTLDNLQKGIIEISSNLRQMVMDLKTTKALTSLITFNHETKQSVEKYQSLIFKQIKNNEEFESVPNLNYAALNRIKQAISQVVTLKFNYPEELKSQIKVTTIPSQVPVIVSQNGVVFGTNSNTFSQTCINSLRSSVNNQNQQNVLIPSNKLQSVVRPSSNYQKIVPGFKKFTQSSVTSPIQGKPGIGRFNAENRC